MQVLRAARAFGIPDAHVQSVSGGSGQTWTAGDYFLRVRPPDRLRIELAAMAAASSAVPTPRVVATIDLDTVSAALLERKPGSPAGDVREVSVAQARIRGWECGRLHGLLAAVAAPGTIPAPAFTGSAADGGDPSRMQLLHLDLHPFNVLVDADGQVTAVLDWANAARGRPELDRARTLSILTLDPAAVKRRSNPRWSALSDAWIAAGGLGDVPDDARAWACRYMLADLSHRYPDSFLGHVRAALRAAEGAR